MRFLYRLLPLILGSAVALSADVGHLLDPLDFTSLSPASTLVRAPGPRPSDVRVAPVASVPAGHLGQPTSVALTATALEKRLSKALTHRFQPTGKIELSLAREWQEFPVAPDWELRLLEVTPDELATGNFVRFSILENGRELALRALPVKLRHMVGVHFLKTALPRGVRPTSEHLETRTVDILRGHSGAVNATTRLAGYQCTVNLQVGSPLKWNHLAKVTLVRRGQVVDVFASGNGIYVSMKGQAMEDGVEGQYVSIRNLSSKREFQAKVLDENSVKVSF